MSIQTYLQKRYLRYLQTVAKTLKHKPNLLGFLTMNEPSKGLIDIPHLHQTNPFPVPLGHTLSFFDQMVLGSGGTLYDVPFYRMPFVYAGSTDIMNGKGRTVWKSREDDVWLREGIYQIDDVTGERSLLKPHYFRKKGSGSGDGNNDGDFMERHMLPFYRKVQQVISRENERFVVYAEPMIDLFDPKVEAPPKGLDGDHFGWSPHWYDFITVLFKKYIPWLGININTNSLIFTKDYIDYVFQQTFASMKKSGHLDTVDPSDDNDNNNSNLHVLLGETGIPFDPPNTNANHATSDDFLENTIALDRTLRAIERNDLEYVLWNYSHDNTASEGDHWNGEDFSIFADGRSRGLLTVVRPYVSKLDVEFEVKNQKFDPSLPSKPYTLEVRCTFPSKGDDKDEDYQEEGNVIVYLPRIHFQNAILPPNTIYDSKLQQLTWRGLTCKRRNQIFRLEVTNNNEVP